MAKMVVRRVGVFSMAKLQAVVMAAMGLIIGVPLGLIMMLFGAALMTQGGEAAAGGGIGIGMGLFYMILLPIMYGIMGLIFGALSALVYNIAAGVLGGLELELENSSPDYVAPPPPPQWESNQYGAGQAPY